ncbi:putative PEP-binding protein, partial [Pyramidobacter sp. C12-8]|uniref:putative PEP-binding protein n=1 Tax=Pyramidobacter sp. C12-8 TaxID=1943580 RepID=UPI0009D242F0
SSASAPSSPHKNGIWVGICGELGADAELTETFLSIGIDELSVSPRSVLPLRKHVREITVGDCKERLMANLLSDQTTE